MRRRSSWGWAVVAFGLGCNGLGCDAPARPATHQATAASAASPAGKEETKEAKDAPSRSIPERDALVPEAVATFHRKAFEPSTAASDLGTPLGVVTLHGVGFERGFFHVLALFETGKVATWRQTPGKPMDQMFFAQLTPGELATAKEHLASWTTSPGQSAERAPGSVMGVSARREGAVITRYFDDGALPSDVSRWVGMLKQRLEATNGGG